MLAVLLTAVILAPTITEARDSSRVEIGSLTCRIDGGASYVFGSTRRLNCKYESARGDPPDYYDGEIDRFGVDLGVTGETVMGWAVFAPSRGVGDHALAGTYRGVAADASLGLGGGAKVLVGGSDNAISLQPVSLQGQSGANLALTVARLRLRPMR
ncbi:MAG: DUF992 domain-containing protein [Dichotomicrobium sp.]